jgi:hypothetical protein
VASPNEPPPDTTSLRLFARVYVISTLTLLVGIALFIGGAALSVVTPIGAWAVVIGLVSIAVGLVAGNVNGYRLLRRSGASRYSAWMRCGGVSLPLWRRYKQHRALLNERPPSP